MTTACDPVVLWSDAMFTRLARVARAYCRAWYAEMDDLVQEACVAVLHWLRVNGGEPMSQKMLTCVVKRRLIAYRRHLSRLGGRETIRDEWGRESPDADLAMDVRDAIHGLPSRMRRAVVGRAYEYRSFDDLAQAYGLSPRTVAEHQREAYTALRGGLDADYGRSVARTAARRKKWTHNQDRRKGVNWSSWGPIPGQRRDDP